MLTHRGEDAFTGIDPDGIDHWTSMDYDARRGCKCCPRKDRKVPFRGYGSRRDRDCGEPVGYDVMAVLENMSATIAMLGSSGIDPIWIRFEMESSISGSWRQGVPLVLGGKAKSDRKVPFCRSGSRRDRYWEGDATMASLGDLADVKTDHKARFRDRGS